ncbi:MAG: IclR family transcriptional regulator, partial [Burkholderiaceae bacterium]
NDPGAPPEAPRKPRVRSAARTMAVMLAVAQESRGATAKELAEKLQLPRQVLYHLLHTLEGLDMVRKQSGMRYVLGLGVAPLLEGFRRQMRASDMLGEIAREAAFETGETAYVSGWVDNDIVVRVTAPGHAPVRAAEVPVGTGGNAHARASGKLLLSMLPLTERQRYLQTRPLQALTPRTLTSPAALQAEFERIQQIWMAIEVEEFAEGLACVAVPIGTPPSQLALAISVPVERFRARSATYVAQLQQIAARSRGDR